METEREEFAIYATWGKSKTHPIECTFKLLLYSLNRFAATQFWTSLNDLQTEGLWKWDSTGGSLYPGYANWDIGEPNNSGGNEDCAILNKATIYGGWDDCQCSKLYGAVCELHPQPM